MSISTPNSTGHAYKRRKLSHSSDSEDGSRHEATGKRTGVLHVATPDNDTTSLTSKPGTSIPNRKSDATMMTGGLTKSSVMQLQADDLVKETRPDYEHTLRTIKPIYEELIQTIKSTPEQQPITYLEAEKTLRKKHKVVIPYTRFHPDTDIKYKFEFKHPESITARGNLVHNLGTKDGIHLEVAVQMPSVIIQEKDYLNHRALHKRAYYIACIATGIKENLANQYNCRFSYQDGNVLVPVIIVDRKDSSIAKKSGAQNNVKITITAILPSNIGPIEKMLPGRNCVRRDNDKREQATPTPLYNSTVRSLASVSSRDKIVDQALQRCEAFADACSLGQIWLSQRGFTAECSDGGFGLSEWTYMCALLLTGGGHKGRPLFSDRYSSVQLFKAMLQVLANRDLSDPISINASDVRMENINLPILFDGFSGVNVLAKMTKWSYETLRHEALLSLTAVNDRAQDNFEASFIAKIAEAALQYDEIYNVTAVKPSISALKLYTVLKKGFGDRVVLLNLKESVSFDWDVQSSDPNVDEQPRIFEVRLLVNSDAKSRLIDHGPTAEQQEEAKEFREFWGEKAELRRFRDGSITETLVWASNTPVTLQILRYLLAHHFTIQPSNVESKTPDLQSDYLATDAPIHAEDAFKLINNKYQELSSKLHQMEGLPLPIRSVSQAGQALRSAAAAHPLDPATSAPIDILIQFDSSARWPDHLLAIQHTKIAFLAKIADLVIESDSSLTSRIGLEKTSTSTTGYHNTSFLDIIYPSQAPGLSPIVFRLRIHHERELHLLQNLLASKELSPPNRDMVAAALSEHKRTFLASPVHTASIRNLTTHFQPFSTTMRLLKFWFASHRLSNHVPDPALEIIAARVFLRPYPWSTPGNATSAFLRCIHFLSHWDWAASPLIIDLSLSQDMAPSQLTELQTRFQAWRKLDPNMNTVAWFIGTNIDNTGTIWTQGAKPARVVASRVTALAKAAMGLMKSKGTAMLDTDWKSLFMSPTSDFDFVIHLKSSVLRGGKKGNRKNGEAKFKNLQVQEDLDVDSIGHDVVELYLEDLERAFSNVVLFFHGERGRHIAGLWRPSVTGKKDWRVRLGYSTVPYTGQGTDEEGNVKAVAEINKDGILAEMALLGEGLVEKISMKE